MVTDASGAIQQYVNANGQIRHYFWDMEET